MATTEPGRLSLCAVFPAMACRPCAFIPASCDAAAAVGGVPHIAMLEKRPVAKHTLVSLIRREIFVRLDLVMRSSPSWSLAHINNNN
jgi:hypothetical protein